MSSISQRDTLEEVCTYFTIVILWAGLWYQMFFLLWLLPKRIDVRFPSFLFKYVFKRNSSFSIYSPLTSMILYKLDLPSSVVGLVIRLFFPLVIGYEGAIARRLELKSNASIVIGKKAGRVWKYCYNNKKMESFF